MKVLADRHHAGLFHSLQLLGDQLGWDIYTPVGREWWDAGYWRFGQVYGDERLVDQYLSVEGGAWSGWKRVSGDIYWTQDRDYPERWIHGVPLESAQRQSWDLVIATVQENQEGFARFAQETGAKYVYGVGNTRQQVDWALDPLALVSSEAEIQGRGVRYHQAMDPSFDWSEPVERHVIRSFVNLMPQIECWPALTVTWSHLNSDFLFRVHGAGCPDGVLQPTTAVAQAMAGSGFGWHDKITGDGFGHVLWGWAAVGRPIIGHASHYAGQLGEVLWRDGETCIDLDRHSPDEAAGLIREIASDPYRHAAMCRAMRATFEQHYDTGTERIRALLA